MDLKIKDVAELLDVSETTIRRWLTEGKIPAYRLNHQYRFNRNEIENWMLSCKVNQDKPFGEKQIYPKEEASRGSQQFGLYRAIHKGAVLDDIDVSGKSELIRETMMRTSKDLSIDPEGVSDLLLDREKMMPTALNHGIAVPHTRDFLLKGAFDVVLVVYPKNPIDWGALDGNPVHTLFFLFATGDKRHLHLLAKLAHLSSDPRALKFLQTKPQKPQLLEFVKDWESTIREYES